jgi:NAD(P)-dependent dehydrogenase (short-subunit alcohol dehydrogenase family)
VTAVDRGRDTTSNGRRVAIVTGGSQGIGAGLVAGYRRQGWAVVASARRIKAGEDPDVLAVEGDLAEPATADRIIDVVDAILFLESSPDITGEILHVDGGQTAGH